MKFSRMVAIALLVAGIQNAWANDIDTTEACRHIVPPDTTSYPNSLVTLESITIDGIMFNAGGNISPGTRGESGTDLFGLLLLKCLHIPPR